MSDVGQYRGQGQLELSLVVSSAGPHCRLKTGGGLKNLQPFGITLSIRVLAPREQLSSGMGKPVDSIECC
jgi:hypothetical protein